jgi:predicted nucleotidyltransferase
MQNKIKNDFLSKYKETIKSLYKPHGVWLFSSRSGGFPNEESDIDLIIVSEKFRGSKFIYRMGGFLKNIDYHKHIDAICYTQDVFQKKKSEIGIINEAIEKGLKIL